MMLVDFFDRVYSSIVSRNAFLDKMRFYSALRFLTRRVANWVLPVYLRCTQNNPDYRLSGETDARSGRVIVSLTSFPARISKVWLAIETMLRQTVKPDMIILWLSKEQFPVLDALPENLLRMQERGLRIELRDGDLRSHKKYYYMLKEYPDDIMLTMDDDIFYPTYAIEKLWTYHKAHPDSIISNYSFRIHYENRMPAEYATWENNVRESSSGFDLFFGTGGGTLFPAGSLAEEAANIDAALDICRNADDVWLNGMCRLKKTKIVKTDYYSVILPVLIKHNFRLVWENVGQNGNDAQIRGLCLYCENKYHINPFSEITNK